MHKNEELGFIQGNWIVDQRGENLYRFRKGPVPSFVRYGGWGPDKTVNRHRWYSHRPAGNFRYPRTLRSLKAFFAHTFDSRYEDESFKVRVKGNRHLPTSWDDQYNKRCRSWKDFRNTQYKERN